MKIFVLTDFPSPYQTEIFNQITNTGGAELHIGYLRGLDPDRQWQLRPILHQSIILDSDLGALSKARSLVNSADLVVFNYYLHPQAQSLLAERARLKRPWCFWGERPGFRKPEWIGQVVRHWKLRWLHSSKASIWGIGEFAVDGYKSEFGSGRKYFNLPYFSDLKRFNNGQHSNGHTRQERVILFSGSLTRRKGVDLLAHAFVGLVAEGYDVKLRILGAGDLRQSVERQLRGVVERVEFLGFADWQNLPSFYAEAHVLCVPSRYDGWGLVVPEGLAAGLPVIATDRMGAALEFIETGRNGWLIKAGDQNWLLEALRAAASLTSDQLSSMSIQARESVRRHTLEEGARRFLQYANDAVVNWQRR
ncbi:MAG TPA: glycosyltransferase family 4 protein [Pyrinomonadaceae bacterium]